MNRVASLLLLFLSVVLPLHVRATSRLCETLVGAWSTDFVYGNLQSSAMRVEARQCGGEASIQLVAWKRNEHEPALVVDTGDLGVTAAFCRHNLFVIETGGATRDQVFVIAFHDGVPKLELSQGTKGQAQIDADDHRLRLRIPKPNFDTKAPAKIQEYNYSFEHD